MHMPGRESFLLACVVGVTTACVRFMYAVGFYKSAGAKDLSRGIAGNILYCILFVGTLFLVPLFSLFELLAMTASLFGVGGAEVQARPRLESTPVSKFDW